MIAIPLLSFVLAASAPGHASTSPAAAALAQDTVHGRVTDPSGQPVAGAQVTVLELERATRTARDGTFALGGLPAGEYTLRITAPGYTSQTRRVTAQGGESLDVALAERSFDLEPVAVTATRATELVSNSPLP